MTAMEELQQRYAKASEEYANDRTQDNWLKVASLEWRIEREKGGA